MNERRDLAANVGGQVYTVRVEDLTRFWVPEGGDDEVVSSAVLPGLRAAALCEPSLVAITDDGSVWIAKFSLWEGTVNGPVHTTNATAYREWKEVSLAWAR